MPFNFCNNKGNIGHPQIGTVRPDAAKAISECENRTVLFMAHQVRVAVQKRRIIQIQNEVRADNSQSKVLLLMDFNMKFEFMFAVKKLWTSSEKGVFHGMAFGI